MAKYGSCPARCLRRDILATGIIEQLGEVPILVKARSLSNRRIVLADRMVKPGSITPLII
jgi:hypothetical protein